MHEPSLVRRRQRVDDLCGDVERFRNRQRPLGEPCVQRLAFDELEHEKPGSVALLESVDLRDVGVVQRGQHARLALETRQMLGLPREGSGDELDGDVSLEPRVAGPVHLAHSARAEEAQDLVGAEPGARGESHSFFTAARTRDSAHAGSSDSFS